MQEALLCLKEPASENELKNAERIASLLKLQYGEMKIILQQHRMEIPE
jgi:hypothetical protein